MTMTTIWFPTERAKTHAHALSKKRYSILPSDPLAERFDRVARRRNGAKSAMIEEALMAVSIREQHPRIDEGVAATARPARQGRSTAVGRDVVVATETVALFVRYFLTVTPPLADQ